MGSIFSSLPAVNIKYNQPLAPLTTLGSGGNAEFFTAPESVNDLQTVIKALPDDYPVYVIGGGSNILIPDGLINGLTVSLKNLKSITWLSRYTAEINSGFPLPMLMKTLRDNHLGGLEFAAGIPGTLGGAFSGNAGAGGHGVCELVDSVKAVDSSGEIITLGHNDFEYDYRHCSVSGMIIVSLTMTFRDSNPDDESLCESFRAKRKNQPLNARSAGCTFKNPEGDSAGRLLDICGCKGLRIGDACVSCEHANFILNTGHASSSDISSLIGLCAVKVRESTGIILETEIKTFSPCFFTQ